MPDFLLAAKRLNDGYMSQQKGYISWQQLVDGETWADLITLETMEDAKRASEPAGTNALAEAFYSFLDLESCEMHLFSVEKSYALGR